MAAKNKKEQHLCAMDCANVCRCPYALSKKKEPEKYRGLVAEPFKMWDDGSWLQAYRVTECPHYERDKRAIMQSSVPPAVRKHKYSHWTKEELAKLLSLCGKMTHLEIADELSRPLGSISKMIKKIKRSNK